MGQTEDPPTAEDWATQAMALGVLKMETSEDLAYTSRHIQIIGMLSLVVDDILVTLDTPGAYINRGV